MSTVVEYKKKSDPQSEALALELIEALKGSGQIYTTPEGKTFKVVNAELFMQACVALPSSVFLSTRERVITLLEYCSKDSSDKFVYHHSFPQRLNFNDILSKITKETEVVIVDCML